MKQWSRELIEQSRLYLEIDGVNLKSLNGQSSILNINHQNNIYTINIKNTNQTFIFNSVDEIINDGWAVD